MNNPNLNVSRKITLAGFDYFCLLPVRSKNYTEKHSPCVFEGFPPLFNIIQHTIYYTKKEGKNTPLKYRIFPVFTSLFILPLVFSIYLLNTNIMGSTTVSFERWAMDYAQILKNKSANEKILSPFDKWRMKYGPLIKQLNVDYDTILLLFKWDNLRDNNSPRAVLDAVFTEACHRMIEYGFISYRTIQRHFRVPYIQALHILQKMEAIGVLRLSRLELHHNEVEEMLVHSKEELNAKLNAAQLQLTLNFETNATAA
jgi:hypothetical protein